MISHPQTADNVDVARARCRRYRKRILDLSQKIGALHIAPAFSCLEMVDSIYHSLLRRKNPTEFKDIFLMSKGHGCMSQYVVLEDMGILSKENLDAYCSNNGILGAHPDYGNPGIMASTGSLGHGMGMAVGMAYAEKLKNTDVKVYVVLSDGEFQEGSTWEAIMMAANLKLDNLVAFMDLNNFTGLEEISVGHPAFYPVGEKLSAFNWDCYEVNGHDSEEIIEAAKKLKDRPLLVVGQTIKGKGVSFMENVPIWHYRSPNPAEYEQALKEIESI